MLELAAGRRVAAADRAHGRDRRRGRRRAAGRRSRRTASCSSPTARSRRGAAARLAAELRALVVEQLLRAVGGHHRRRAVRRARRRRCGAHDRSRTPRSTRCSPPTSERAPARNDARRRTRPRDASRRSTGWSRCCRPRSAVDALVAFTGHFTCSRPISTRPPLSRRVPAGEFRVPFSPASGSRGWRNELRLRAVHARRGARRRRTPGAGRAAVAAPTTALRTARIDAADAPPVGRERLDRRRGAGLAHAARGLCGRWEVGYEVAPEPRPRARPAVVAAASGLVPAGEPLWAQVPGQRRVDALDARGRVRPGRRRDALRGR